ncbi:hypothetical protein GC177_10280 [bacterium]|nr:hypothetical protein [bacterium]
MRIVIASALLATTVMAATGASAQTYPTPRDTRDSWRKPAVVEVVPAMEQAPVEKKMKKHKRKHKKASK